MFTRLRIFLIGISLAIFATGVFGQIQFSLPTLSNVQPGAEVYVPVICTSGFDSIESIQFVIQWDASVLRFAGTQDYTLSDLNSTHFGYQANQPNLVRFAYTAPNIVNGAGVSTLKNTHLFVLKFVAIGPINSGTAITITEDTPITYFEIVAANGANYTLNHVGITPGFVAIGYTGVENYPIHRNHVEVYPNPVTDHVFLKTEMPLKGSVQYALLTTDGRRLHTFANEQQLDSLVKLDFSRVSGSGLMYLLIQTDQWSEIQPIVFKNE